MAALLGCSEFFPFQRLRKGRSGLERAVSRHASVPSEADCSLPGALHDCVVFKLRLCCSRALQLDRRLLYVTELIGHAWPGCVGNGPTLVRLDIRRRGWRARRPGRAFRGMSSELERDTLVLLGLLDVGLLQFAGESIE